jgi:Periplasmic binding protein
MTARLRIGACLSLSGKFAQFGRQAAAGLETWQRLDDSADVLIEDDGSDRRTIERKLPGIAMRCDLLLGPYSTILMRQAGNLAAERDWLVWNHGGSGDDVEAAHPGHVVSVLTPTSRYAVPFIKMLAAGEPRTGLVIAQGPGSFGHQVADGAEAAARSLGMPVSRNGTSEPPDGNWSLFSVGVFEDDARIVGEAIKMPHPPQRICAVAAGVQAFADAIENTNGIYGIAQWFRGSRQEPKLGPGEDAFLSACSAPDYPAVQAAAGAAIAVHCARLAGSTWRQDLWDAARALETSTLFGGFRIDASGRQVAHETALVRWVDGQLRQAATI